MGKSSSFHYMSLSEGMKRGVAGMQLDHNWQRRHAIQIVAQLPETTEDALMVLELAKELVETFLLDRQPRPALAEVMAFPASANSR